MDLNKVSSNSVVTGQDGGRGAANLNYILYIIGFFVPLTALIGVVLAYSHRDRASAIFQSHFEWQIKIFWRSVKFLVVTSVLYFLFTIIGVFTLGLGFVLYLIPFAVAVWWFVSTIMRIANGMKALGLGVPVSGITGTSRTATSLFPQAPAEDVASQMVVAVEPGDA